MRDSPNIFAINKPKGPTSFRIVNEIRKITGEKRVGHAGTLDPLAQGILVIGVGREATRKLNEIVQKEKEYIAEIFLGKFSNTDDEEGEKIEVKIKKPPTQKQIKSALKNFKGLIKQVPPIFSAVKIGGRRAYKLARKGETPKLKPRRVEIKSIKILKYQWPILKIKVKTGPGVYIRALARDLGKKLEVGAYLKSLIRTRVGQYNLKNAITLKN